VNELLRLTAGFTILLLTLPILAGLAGALLPAFGWLPALGGEAFGVEPWIRLLAQPGIVWASLVSLGVGLAATLASLVIVFLFLAGTGSGRFYQLIRRLLSPILSVPHAASALGLAFLIAPSGWLARLFSPWATGWERPPDLLILHDPYGLAMVLALIGKEVPFLLLMALAALSQIDAERRMMVARSLGYGRVTGWLKSVAPALYPLIRLPLFAILAYGSSTVDIAIVVGPTAPPPLSVMVLRWLNDPDISLRFMASAGALLQLAITLAGIGLWWLAEVVTAALFRRWVADGRRQHADELLARLGRVVMLLIWGAAVLGLAALLLYSVAGFWRFPDALPHGLTLRHWRQAWPDVAEATLSTIGIGMLASLSSVALVIAALENEWRRGRRAGPGALTLLYLPLIVPQIAFLFGLMVALEGLGLRPGFWPVALLHVLFVLPYAYLSLSEAYRRFDRRWEQLGRSLGHGVDAIFWRVRLPMLLTPVLVSLALGFAVSIGQYLPTLLGGAGRVVTLTTEAVALSTGGDRRVTGVWALTQALLPFLGFALALLLTRLLWRNRREMRGGAA
jgi:putative thiamine transport system permease protein